eukprot:3527677-Rhodomonas_salina.4
MQIAGARVWGAWWTQTQDTKERVISILAHIQKWQGRHDYDRAFGALSVSKPLRVRSALS